MKRILNLLFATILALVVCVGAAAQQYPAKTIVLICPTPAGGTTDVLARDIAKALSERLGQSVVVENVTGGGGMLAIRRLINANADGHTLMFSMNGLMANQAMRVAPGFDVTKDVTAIAPMFEGYFGIYINADIPAKTLQEFIAYAKSRPGKLNYGTTGIGSLVHLVTDDFLQMAGIQMVHVPYKGGAEYLPAAVSNQVQLVLADTTLAQPFIDSGRLRLLAVTSKQRLTQLPNAPTTGESGLPEYRPSFWAGLYAPRDTTPQVVDRLNRELRSILMNDEARQRYAARGYIPVWLSPVETQTKVRDELARINKTIDAGKIERQ